MQMWTKIGSSHLNTLLRNRRYPRQPDVTINVPGLKSPVNMDDNYGLRLTTYYRVGTHSIHFYSQRNRSSKRLHAYKILQNFRLVKRIKLIEQLN